MRIIQDQTWINQDLKQDHSLAYLTIWNKTNFKHSHWLEIYVPKNWVQTNYVPNVPENWAQTNYVPKVPKNWAQTNYVPKVPENWVQTHYVPNVP